MHASNQQHPLAANPIISDLAKRQIEQPKWKDVPGQHKRKRRKLAYMQDKKKGHILSVQIQKREKSKYRRYHVCKRGFSIQWQQNLLDLDHVGDGNVHISNTPNITHSTGSALVPHTLGRSSWTSCHLARRSEGRGHDTESEETRNSIRQVRGVSYVSFVFPHNSVKEPQVTTHPALSAFPQRLISRKGFCTVVKPMTMFSVRFRTLLLLFLGRLPATVCVMRVLSRVNTIHFAAVVTMMAMVTGVPFLGIA
jgi:hypothetical protein